jgi:hypothetical protein
MASDPAEDLARELTDLHARLLRGDLADIGPLSTRIESALADLAARRGPGADLATVRLLAGRNLPVLDAAAKGMRAARLRLFEVQQAKSGLGTYNRDGQRNLIAPGTGPAHRS